MALEHPKSGRPVEVGSLGLLCFLPDSYEADKVRAGLFGSVTWVEVPREDDKFSEFLGEVVSVLDGADPLPASPECAWCALKEPIRVAA